jgi:hypothetical protein
MPSVCISVQVAALAYVIAFSAADALLMGCSKLTGTGVVTCCLVQEPASRYPEHFTAGPDGSAACQADAVVF